MDFYTIRRETLESIADEVRRLGKVEEPLSPDEMKQILSKLEIPEIPEIDPNATELWAYLDRRTLHINRADKFLLRGTTLEVQWNGID